MASRISRVNKQNFQIYVTYSSFSLNLLGKMWFEKNVSPYYLIQCLVHHHHHLLYSQPGQWNQIYFFLEFRFWSLPVNKYNKNSSESSVFIPMHTSLALLSKICASYLLLCRPTKYSLVVFEQIPSVDESPATDISLEWLLAGYVYASAYHMSWAIFPAKTPHTQYYFLERRRVTE